MDKPFIRKDLSRPGNYYRLLVQFQEPYLTILLSVKYAKTEVDMENAIIRCILDRHCCRDFTDGEIPEEDLETLVEALRWSPSAGNLQPWFFYIVKNKDVKKRLAKAALGQNFIIDAAVLFVICAIPSQSAQVYGKRGSELYCIQDTAAAAQNLFLAATSMGYRACWVGAFDENKVIEALELTPEKRPVAIVPVGPGIKNEKTTERYSVNKICKVID